MHWKRKKKSRSPKASVFITTAADNHTTINENGAVRSIQKATVSLLQSELQELWQSQYLERLARTYWRYLSFCTLGLIRVIYTPAQRYVVLLSRRLILLTFCKPEYTVSENYGCVRWRIQSGLLVARAGHHSDGYLQIEVRQIDYPTDPDQSAIEVIVEVANFYPTIAKRFTTWFYRNTQARIHVIVTHGFLRSLQKLKLAESKVGTFTTDQG